METNIVADSEDFIPKYWSEGAVCCDLVANFSVPPEVDGQSSPITQSPDGQRILRLPHRRIALIDCGFSMELPPGYKANISVRSNVGKRGLVAVNAPGKIDSDYRGRIKVTLCNVGTQSATIKHGERFAQMEIEPVYKFKFKTVNKLNETIRGSGGFGSTGVK